MKSTHDKLERYKELEAVFFTNTQSWNSITGFGSAISRFVTKVAQLDLFCDRNENPGALNKLISEIEDLLNQHVDAFVKLVCPTSSDFCNNYKTVRSRF